MKYQSLMSVAQAVHTSKCGISLCHFLLIWGTLTTDQFTLLNTFFTVTVMTFFKEGQNPSRVVRKWCVIHVLSRYWQTTSIFWRQARGQGLVCCFSSSNFIGKGLTWFSNEWLKQKDKRPLWNIKAHKRLTYAKLCNSMVFLVDWSQNVYLTMHEVIYLHLCYSQLHTHTHTHWHRHRLTHADSNKGSWYSVGMSNPITTVKVALLMQKMTLKQNEQMLKWSTIAIRPGLACIHLLYITMAKVWAPSYHITREQWYW